MECPWSSLAEAAGVLSQPRLVLEEVLVEGRGELQEATAEVVMVLASSEASEPLQRTQTKIHLAPLEALCYSREIFQNDSVSLEGHAHSVSNHQGPIQLSRVRVHEGLSVFGKRILLSDARLKALCNPCPCPGNIPFVSSIVLELRQEHCGKLHAELVASAKAEKRD